MQTRWVSFLLLGVSIVLCKPASVYGQECEDFDQCTDSEMCLEGECFGMPISGSSCDDFNECTTEDSCLSGECVGTPVPNGTLCRSGCGTCTNGVCVGLPENDGEPCEDDLGACTENDRCQFVPLINTVFCVGDFVECPDVDGDPCTVELCDVSTGECLASGFPFCDEECETFNSMTGGCAPLEDGLPCDDLNECTEAGQCEDGFCQEGPPIAGEPTGTKTPSATATSFDATATPSVPEPTDTPTIPDSTPMPTSPAPTAVPPSPTATLTVPTPTPSQPIPKTCVGDCNGDGVVTVDSLIRGVNIALGSLPLDECSSLDVDGDQIVGINELIGAVNAALNGCA